MLLGLINTCVLMWRGNGFWQLICNCRKGQDWKGAGEAGYPTYPIPSAPTRTEAEQWASVQMMRGGCIYRQTKTSRHGWIKITAYWLVHYPQCRPTSAAELKSALAAGKTSSRSCAGKTELLWRQGGRASDQFTFTTTETNYFKPFSDMEDIALLASSIC